MNPFTRFLRQWSRDPDLDDFVEKWDALEKLVIRVYKGGRATEGDEQQYQALRAWLQQHYRRFGARLEPYWRQARVAGKPAQQDPFLRLTAPEQAAAFAGDWQAMQNLPAAREALNRLLLEEREE